MAAAVTNPAGPALPAQNQGQSPGVGEAALLRTLAQVHEESARLATAAQGGDNAKVQGAKDPSLETSTPDVVYINGVPHYQGRTLLHPLSYANAKVNERNSK